MLGCFEYNAPYVKAQLDVVKIYRGTKVVNFSGSWSTLFTIDEMTQLLGRLYNDAFDSVYVMNGDNTSQLGTMITCAAHSDGTIRLYAKQWGASNEEITGEARINYIVVSGI